MAYVKNLMPDTIKIDGVYGVLKIDYSKRGVGVGESHSFPELIFMSNGEHHTIIDGKEIKLQKGQLLFIEPGAFHKSACSSNSEGLIISFDSSSTMLLNLYGISPMLTKNQQDEFCSIVNMGFEYFYGAEKGGTKLNPSADKYELEIFKKRLEIFLLDIHRSYQKLKTKAAYRREAEFEKVSDYLLKNLDKNLSANEIADDNFICLSKLKGLFKENGGVKNYFITLKIKRAKEEIERGKFNFTEIAENLAFSSVHVFSKTFKKIMGITPSEYKRGKGIYY